MKGYKGFTLIEMLIAMMILAFIAVGTYQSTSQSFTLRANLEEQGDFYNALRVTLDIVNRDIIHFYTPQLAALPGSLAQIQTTPNPDQPQPTPQKLVEGVEPFWAIPINQNGIRPSRLNGEETKLSFLANSHMRLFRDSAESDFVKIIYSLEDNKEVELTSKGWRAFVKYEDPDAFSDKDFNPDTGARYVLLNNIKNIKFRYYDEKKDKFDTKWDTTGQDHRNIYPVIIELTLEVYLPRSNETFMVVQRFKPELPGYE